MSVQRGAGRACLGPIRNKIVSMCEGAPRQEGPPTGSDCEKPLSIELREMLNKSTMKERGLRMLTGTYEVGGSLNTSFCARFAMEVS